MSEDTLPLFEQPFQTPRQCEVVATSCFTTLSSNCYRTIVSAKVVVFKVNSSTPAHKFSSCNKLLMRNQNQVN